MRVGLVVSCLNTLSEEIVSALNSRETSDIVAVVQNKENSKNVGKSWRFYGSCNPSNCVMGKKCENFEAKCTNLKKFSKNLKPDLEF